MNSPFPQGEPGAERAIPAGQFKARCLKLMEEVRRQRTSLIITKHGKPVARLTPVEAEPAPSLFGFLKGTVEIHGDLTEPTGDVWQAEL